MAELERLTQRFGARYRLYATLTVMLLIYLLALWPLYTLWRAGREAEPVVKES